MKHYRAHAISLVELILLMIFFDAHALIAADWQYEAGTYVYIEDKSGSEPEIMLVLLEEDYTKESEKVNVSMLDNSLFKTEKIMKNVMADNIATCTGCTTVNGICVGQTVKSVGSREESSVRSFDEGVVVGIFSADEIAVLIWDPYYISWSPRPIVRIKSALVKITPKTRWEWPQLYGNGPKICTLF